MCDLPIVTKSSSLTSISWLLRWNDFVSFLPQAVCKEAKPPRLAEMANLTHPPGEAGTKSHAVPIWDWSWSWALIIFLIIFQKDCSPAKENQDEKNHSNMYLNAKKEINNETNKSDHKWSLDNHVRTYSHKPQQDYQTLYLHGHFQSSINLHGSTLS